MTSRLLLLSLCFYSITSAMIVKTKPVSEVATNKNIPQTEREDIVNRCKKLMELPHIYVATEIDACLEEMRKLSNVLEVVKTIKETPNNYSSITSFFDGMEGSKNKSKLSALEIRSFRESVEKLVQTQCKRTSAQPNNNPEQMPSSSQSHSVSSIPDPSNYTKGLAQPPALPPRPAQRAILSKRAMLGTVSKKSVFQRTATDANTQTVPIIMNQQRDSTSLPHSQNSLLSGAQAPHLDLASQCQTRSATITPQATSTDTLANSSKTSLRNYEQDTLQVSAQTPMLSMNSEERSNNADNGDSSSAATAGHMSTVVSYIVFPRNGSTFEGGANAQSSYYSSNGNTVVTRSTDESNSTYVTTPGLEKNDDIEL